MDYAEEHYKAVIQALEVEIMSKYGTVTAFAKKAGVSRYNLSLVFRGHQLMSVNLFVRVSHELGLVDKLPPPHNSNLTLIDYFKLPYHDIYAAATQLIIS